MSMLMPQQLLSLALEKAINQAITLHHGEPLPLSSLEQKSLAITLSELGFSLVFTISFGKVLVGTNNENADCVIETSLTTLVELKENQQLTSLIKEDKLEIAGDIKVAQKFISLFEAINIDWQSEIAKHIGDIPTYKLDRARQNIVKKVAFATEQVQADMSEYIVHEKRLVVTASEISHFNKEVALIEQSVDALMLRLAKFEDLMQYKLP